VQQEAVAPLDHLDSKETLVRLVSRVFPDQQEIQVLVEILAQWGQLDRLAVQV